MLLLLLLLLLLLFLTLFVFVGTKKFGFVFFVVCLFLSTKHCGYYAVIAIAISVAIATASAIADDTIYISDCTPADEFSSIFPVKCLFDIYLLW